MTAEEIKNKFVLLVKEHQSIGDSLDELKDAELIEVRGLGLIADYCRAKGYEWDYKNTEVDAIGQEKFSRLVEVFLSEIKYISRFSFRKSIDICIFPN
jgi:hypothetical protein